MVNNDSIRVIEAMSTLATIMDEDVDLVTQRFKELLSHIPTSWKVTYLTARFRAARGIRDPWFYDPPK